MSDFGVQLKDYNQQISTLCNILLKTDTNTFTIHVSDSRTVEFLLSINPQFTTSAQNILHLNQRTHGHVRTRPVAPFLWSPGSCKRFDWLTKMYW